MGLAQAGFIPIEGQRGVCLAWAGGEERMTGRHSSVFTDLPNTRQAKKTRVYLNSLN